MLAINPALIHVPLCLLGFLAVFEFNMSESSRELCLAIEGQIYGRHGAKFTENFLNMIDFDISS